MSGWLARTLLLAAASLGPAPDSAHAHEDAPPYRLTYSTLLGDGDGDDCDGIALDAARDIYLACHCGSPSDFVVIKLSADGKKVLYRTTLKGARWDAAVDIAVDARGFAYVTGRTASADFPVTAGAFRSSYAGGEGDVVMVKLDPAGAVLYSTFFGGSGDDKSARIAIDSAGDAYIAGWTTSADLPTTVGVLQAQYRGDTDAFVAKFSPSGALLYATYLGGAGSEWVTDSPRAAPATDLALAPDGSVVLVGSTRSADFPLLEPLQPTLKGRSDAFISRIDPTGSSLTFSSYLGGSAADEGAHVAIDREGAVYVAGITSSPDFPTTSGAFQARHAGGEPFFLTKLDATHRELVYSSFLGGARGDRGWIGRLAVDPAGRAFVTGQVRAPDFPVTRPLQRSLQGLSDGFLTVIDPRGEALAFSTYLGGSDSDAFEGMGLDPQGGVHIAGYTRSRDFPLINSLKKAFRGGMNIVVLELSPP